MDSNTTAAIEAPGRPDEERAAQLLQELEPLVRRVARRWSRDHPDALDDLAQEARIAVWQLLKERPNIALPILVNEAKESVLDERKRGKSVDGRLNPTTARSRAWVMESLDHLASLAEGPGPQDTLARSHSGRHDPWSSPIEEEAIGHVLYQELQRTLTFWEDTYLALLLLGYRHKDAGMFLGLTKKQVGYIQRVLKRKTVALLDGGGDGDAPSPRTKAAQKAARARWGWDRRPAFRIPATLTELLTLLDGEWS